MLVDDSFSDAEWAQVFSTARTLHADARRALLVGWGAWADQTSARRILQGMAVGDINYYILKPWTTRDELFHRVIAEFVQDWSRNEPDNLREVVVVADPHSSRAFAISDLLARNRIPYAFRSRESHLGQDVLKRTGHREGDVVVWIRTRRTRRRPAPPVRRPPAECRSRGRQRAAHPGGGARGHRRPGGHQLTDPQLPRLLARASGSDLAQRGYQRAWVFGARFCLMRDVAQLRRNADRFVAELGDVGEVSARAVIVSSGVSYRRLGVPSLEELSGKGVHYGASVSAGHALTGLDAAVVGGGNSAGQAVLHLARYCRRVHLVVRGPDLTRSMSAYLIHAIAAEPVIEVHCDTEVVDGSGNGRLEGLTLRARSSGRLRQIPAEGLFVMIGAQPRTDWLPTEVARDRFGFLLTGADAAGSGAWPEARRPHPYETTVPGLFAVGDVRCGSVKRVASAVGGGSVVVSEVHEFLNAHA